MYVFIIYTVILLLVNLQILHVIFYYMFFYSCRLINPIAAWNITSITQRITAWNVRSLTSDRDHFTMVLFWSEY